jgi:hypothetical protein
MPVLSLISRETDSNGFLRNEKYVSEKGTEYTIEPTAGGLWTIVSHGGGPSPRICDGSYTSHLRARSELQAYLESTDRLGFAEYTGKDPAKVRKVKNGPSEN